MLCLRKLYTLPKKNGIDAFASEKYKAVYCGLRSRPAVNGRGVYIFMCKYFGCTQAVKVVVGALRSPIMPMLVMVYLHGIMCGSHALPTRRKKRAHRFVPWCLGSAVAVENAVNGGHHCLVSRVHCLRKRAQPKRSTYQRQARGRCPAVLEHRRSVQRKLYVDSRASFVRLGLQWMLPLHTSE